MPDTVSAERETGSKAVRAEPFAAQCEAGNVYLKRGPRNNSFIDELCNFPTGSNDDQVDAGLARYEIRQGKMPMRISKAVMARAAGMGRR